MERRKKAEGDSSQFKEYCKKKKKEFTNRRICHPKKEGRDWGKNRLKRKMKPASRRFEDLKGEDWNEAIGRTSKRNISGEERCVFAGRRETRRASVDPEK